ncbi:MAG: hypothetical protein ACR2JC_06155 [Chloroflexota bacterium]
MTSPQIVAVGARVDARTFPLVLDQHGVYLPSILTHVDGLRIFPNTCGTSKT